VITGRYRPVELSHSVCYAVIVAAAVGAISQVIWRLANVLAGRRTLRSFLACRAIYCLPAELWILGFVFHGQLDRCAALFSSKA